MPLLGQAALAMWFDMEPARRVEFEHWHSHEHFPERLRIPGFLRGSRWQSAAGDDGYFVMYEVERHATLTSPHYLARLNDPTPWSTTLMPHHRNMVRSQCRTVATFGGGIARSMLTVRLAPAVGRADQLRAYLTAWLRQLPQRPGITGAHLLQTETPAAALTKEQKIRGGDAVADWIALVSGYEMHALEDLRQHGLDALSLNDAGATPVQLTTTHRLSFAMLPGDLDRA